MAFCAFSGCLLGFDGTNHPLSLPKLGSGSACCAKMIFFVYAQDSDSGARVFLPVPQVHAVRHLK